MTSWASPANGPSASVGPGLRLGDRYLFHRSIASGGMAQVWLAEDTLLSRMVAAKVLHPHLATDAGFVTRFRREAVAAARLKHPAIVAIYDTISEGAIEAMVMELIEGRTLRAVLDETGPFGIGEVLHVGISVASALDEAHRAGIVHRDIKPANIMVADDGRVLVMDFGIAKAGTDTDLTATGTLLGTAKYLAPEQVTGGPIDPRSDLFSLGIVLFETLTGTVPFKADTDAATALARLHNDAPAIRDLRPDVPPELDAIVAKMVARRPEDRFARASVVQEALVRLQSKTDGTTPIFPPSSPAARSGSSAPASSAPATAGRRPPEPPAGTIHGPPLAANASGLLGVGAPAGDRSGPRFQPAGPLPPPPPMPVGLRPPDPPAGTVQGPPLSPGAPGLAGSDSGQRPVSGGHLPTPGGWAGGRPDTTDEAPSPGDQERVVRSGRSRLGAVAAVALLVGGMVWAILAGVGPFAGSEDGPQSAEPAPVITRLRSFDPLSSDPDKLEREDLVTLAADGDPTTAWRTETYRGPALAGLKDGVGLLVEVEAPGPLNALDLVTTSEGWTMEIYVADSFGDDPSTWGQPLATVVGGAGEQRIDLGGAEGGIVLLWLRDTGQTEGRYRFSLGEISIA